MKDVSKKKSHGAAPFSVVESKKTLHKNLEFTAAEQYKLLRTNLAFTLPSGVPCPIIGVTGSMRGEGKSTTAVNLAYVLAEDGKKVLLVDGDLRLPSVARKMGVSNTPGVTNLLMKYDESLIESFKTEVLDNWYILPAGDIPPNPSELIGSQRMKELLDRLSKLFDYIVVDLPPVNIVSDALAISGFITGLVLVIREDYTEKKELETCIRQLKLSNVNVLGCVMNESKNGKGSYSKYRRYKKYYKYSRYSDRYGYYGHGSHYGYYGYYGGQAQPPAEDPSAKDEKNEKKSKGGGFFKKS